MEHVCSVNKTLAEAYPLLKPGGRVIITCPYKGKLSRLHVRTITKDFMKNRIEKYFKLEKMEILKYSKFKPGMFCLGIKNK